MTPPSTGAPEPPFDIDVPPSELVTAIPWPVAPAVPRADAPAGETPLDVERRIHALDTALATHRSWGGCPMTGEEDCCDTMVVELRTLQSVRATLAAQTARIAELEGAINAAFARENTTLNPAAAMKVLHTLAARAAVRRPTEDTQ